MIIKHELSKIARTLILPALIGFFIVLNIFIVMSHSDIKEDLAVLSNLVDTYGYEVDDGMLTEFGADYKQKVAWVNQVAPDKGEPYQHPSELLSDDEFRFDNILSESEFQKLLKYGLIEGYYRTAQNIDETYQDINLEGTAKSLIRMYGFKGEAADSIRDQFEQLDVRLDQLIENGEHKNLFFMGKLYQMHSLLFKDLGRALIFELIILVVLITASITNYEFENRTHLVSYTSKRGRKLVQNKLAAAAIANLGVIAILIGTTLAAYFFTYDYTGLWQVPISSYFNAEMPLPYISWWNFSFLEYLGLFVLCITLCQLLFMGISFILSVFIKNTYLVFFAFAILLGIGVLIPGFVPLDTNMVFAMYFNPFALIMNPHGWWMGNGAFTIYSYYEMATISIWALILVVLCGLSMYFFNRQQLQ
ncbi:hypothetical protein [Alkalihalobacillus sp. AL-G]|uniref:hypothetical protein n=1 Tax=Alkalihalobacillus sp. AL-G TaxID=2926399 RepID=UPI002729FFC3|nr:hypothetical protein [Alkalihalobacillus sp. AL-G]WLD94673.1 hypothetical protein MOJ78_07260 [Alkalihalobacillus sp. AL-G]